jgi:hypothetical protein
MTTSPLAFFRRLMLMLKRPPTNVEIAFRVDALEQGMTDLNLKFEHLQRIAQRMRGLE